MTKIKLVKPGFKTGKEKDFVRFIKNIGSGKTALISHVSDLDGVASAKVIADSIKPAVIRFLDYDGLNSNVAKDLEKQGVKKIVLTDLMIHGREFILELEKFAEVLLIDHHPIEHDYNSRKTVYLNAQGYCAAYLCYYLFSKFYDLEYLDWLIVCASLSDFQYKKSKKWIEKVYEKYNQHFSINGKLVGKDSGFYKLMDNLSLAITYFKPKTERVLHSLGRNYGEIGDLERYSQAVRQEIDVMVNRFEKEKIVIKDGWFFEFECIFQVRSYIVTAISLNYKDKTLIIGEKNGESYRFSLRRQDGKVDVNKMAKKLTNGFENSSAGGHSVASSGNFPAIYLEEFKKRLKNI